MKLTNDSTTRADLALALAAFVADQAAVNIGHEASIGFAGSELTAGLADPEASPAAFNAFRSSVSRGLGKAYEVADADGRLLIALAKAKPEAAKK